MCLFGRFSVTIFLSATSFCYFMDIRHVQAVLRINTTAENSSSELLVLAREANCTADRG